MRTLGLIAVVAVVGACDAASSDPALDAIFRVEGGQFREGAFPADQGGPATVAVSTLSTSVIIAARTEQIRGVLEPSARGVVIGIDGYDGTWIVPATVPGLDTPGFPTASAVFRIAEHFPPGPFVMRVAAADETGRFGPAGSTMLVAVEQPPPTGELVIALTWSGAADLDLHVVDPNGGEAWSQKPSTMPPPIPGVPEDPNNPEYLKHGRLDHDGNQDCRRDPSPNENVIWTMPPPPGEYIVRVDARSMCGAQIAHWTVAVYRNDELIEGAAVRGISTPEDVVRLPLPPAQWHGAGAGTLALRFSL